MELVTEGVNIPVAEKHFFAFNKLVTFSKTHKIEKDSFLK